MLVICPDAMEAGANGTCRPSGACNEPKIPVGCLLGQSVCVNGVSECPPVVCPDSGPNADAGSPSDATTSDATTSDAATSEAGVFTCDSGDGSPISCDGRTQACRIVNGGAAPGIHAPSCLALPASCLPAPTCACLKTALGGAYQCDDRGGNFTLTEDVP